MFWKRECKRVSPLLWGFAARSLPEGDLEQVERHLRRCGACRREVAQYDRAVRLLTIYREQPAPASQTTWHALRARLESERLSPVTQPLTLNAQRATPLLALGGAALSIVLLVVAVNALRSRPTPVGPSNLVRLPKEDRPVRIADNPPPRKDKTEEQAPKANDTQAQAKRPATADAGNGEALPVNDKPSSERGKRRVNPRREERPTPIRYTVEKTLRPIPAQNNLRLAGYGVDGDRPAAQSPKRDFVIETAGFSGGQTPARRYVMDRLPANAGIIHSASYSPQTEEKNAW